VPVTVKCLLALLPSTPFYGALPLWILLLEILSYLSKGTSGTEYEVKYQHSWSKYKTQYLSSSVLASRRESFGAALECLNTVWKQSNHFTALMDMAASSGSTHQTLTSDRVSEGL